MSGDLETAFQIPTAGVILDGDFRAPAHAAGVVVFAHGSGSSRHSPRNRMVAQRLQEAGYATLLMDLLTAEEDEIDSRTRKFRFDIPRLASRWLYSAPAQAQRRRSSPLRKFLIMFSW